MSKELQKNFSTEVEEARARIGERLRFLRTRRKGFDAELLSTILQREYRYTISASDLERVESGQLWPDLSLILALMDLYGVDPGFITGKSDAAWPDLPGYQLLEWVLTDQELLEKLSELASRRGDRYLREKVREALLDLLVS